MLRDDSHFEKAFRQVLLVERGYAEHPADRGGKTMYGVTERVARANGYEGDMREFTEAEASIVYRLQFWQLLRLSAVARLSYPIAEELFECGVNCGPGTAARFLQRALNAFNREAQDYPDLEVDGVLGPLTLDTLKAYLYRRRGDGEIVLLRALNTQQGAHYLGIAERDRSQEAFTFGWFSKRVRIAREASA